MRRPLTPRQKALLDAIAKLIEAYPGTSPTLDEIAEVTGMVKSGVHRLLGQIERKGWIVRRPLEARSIMIVPDKPASDALVKAATALSVVWTSTSYEGADYTPEIEGVVTALEDMR